MELNQWQIYKLRTNASNDVWTKDDFYKKHKIFKKEYIGTMKYRNAIFVKPLRTLPSGEQLLLIAQTNDEDPNANRMEWCKQQGIDWKDYPDWKKIPFQKVDDMVVGINGNKIEGYLSPINVRLALSGEFNNVIAEEKGVQGYVAEDYQNEEFDKILEPLIKHNGRQELFDIAANGGLDNLSEQALNEIISIDQFNVHELSSKFDRNLAKQYHLNNTPLIMLDDRKTADSIRNKVIRSIPEKLYADIIHPSKFETKNKANSVQDNEPEEA